MIRMLLRFLALVLIAETNVVVSNIGIAQVRCDLTQADAPAVRGIRLGMSTEQLLAMFPASTKRKEVKEALEKAKAPDSELVYLVFDPGDGNKELFDSVVGVSAGLDKGRVMEFTIQYVGNDWKGVDEWVAKLSESLKLPGVESWQYGPNESPNKVLACKGIEIEASIQGGGATISVRNTDYRKAVMERIRAAEEKRKRDYKP